MVLNGTSLLELPPVILTVFLPRILLGVAKTLFFFLHSLIVGCIGRGAPPPLPQQVRRKRDGDGN
jgi:hypothetical protein